MAALPDLTIGLLTRGECEEIAAAFLAIGWNRPVERYERYCVEQESGERTILVARAKGHFAGYLTVHWRSDYEPFRNEDIPEIADLNVLPDWRRLGIASALMDEAEAWIAERSAVAGIGVGMDTNYGPAQRMYVKRGYVPDGRGLTHEGRHLRWGETVKVDDGLVLMLTKELGD